MGARTVKFGLTLPQFGASWSEVKEIASLADEVGWDSVWVADHFLGVGSDDPLEAWTEMSAVAAITRRVELGFLVLCNSYRPPALLAKMAVTLDAVSHGRLTLGYGAGWFAQEYEAYGYDFPPIGTRLRQLEEAPDLEADVDRGAGDFSRQALSRRERPLPPAADPQAASPHSHRRGRREGPLEARGPLRGHLEQPRRLPSRDRREARGAAGSLPAGRPELRRDRDLSADGGRDRPLPR